MGGGAAGGASGGIFAPLLSGAQSVITFLTGSFLGPLLIIIAVVTTLIIGFVDAWSKNFGNIQQIVQMTWDNIVKMFSGAIDIIVGIFNFFVGLLTGDTEKVKDSVIQIFREIWNFITGFINTIVGILLTLITTIANIFVNVFNVFAKFGKDIWNWVQEKIPPVINSIIGFFSEMVDGAVTMGSDFIKNIGKGIESAKTWVIDKAREVWSGIKDFFNFDITTNDKMAQKWGKDFIVHFSKGMDQGNKTNITNNVSNTVNVRNAGSTDIVGMSYYIGNALNRQFERTKALGTQYY
jgi:phage-related protein